METGNYVEVEVLAMGRATDGSQTPDEDCWWDGLQTSWNVWATERTENGEFVREVMDLDIPVEAEELAHEIAGAIEDHYIE